MARLPLPSLALFLMLGSCVNNRPMLVQGLIGLTNFDEVHFKDSSVSAPDSSGDLDLNALPGFGFALQKPISPSKYSLDIGWEAGMTLGWDTEKIAFAGGGGGGVVAVRADMVFFDMFGGPYISHTFQNGAFRIFAGGGPLVLWAWVDNADDDVPDDEQFDDSSGEFGSYVRAGIEFDIGPPGTLGLTVQRIDSKVEFNEVGSADVDGYFFAISLTRNL